MAVLTGGLDYLEFLFSKKIQITFPNVLNVQCACREIITERGKEIEGSISFISLFLNTEVFGSNGSVGIGHFVRYSRKSVTLDIFNVKFQFGDCQNVRYSRKKSVISESGTSENLCSINFLAALCKWYLI